jgi:hypothetical protein
MVCQRTINPHGLPWGCCKVGVSGGSGAFGPREASTCGASGRRRVPSGCGHPAARSPHNNKGCAGLRPSRTRLVSALHGLGSYLTASQAWHTLDGTLHRNEIDYQARIGQWSRAFRRIWLKPRFQVTMSAGLLVPIELRCAPEASAEESGSIRELHELARNSVDIRGFAISDWCSRKSL